MTVMAFGSLILITLRAVGFSYAKLERKHWKQPCTFPSSILEFVTPHVMNLRSISFVINFSQEVFERQRNADFLISSY